MKRTDSSFNDYPVTGWQLLGRLNLSRDLDIEPTIHAWLLETLQLINLHMEFFKKLSLSVKSSAVNSLEPHHEKQALDHIHLLLFVRRKQETESRSWGFFHIEKLEGSTNENGPPDHSIEFYIYPDG
jgi:hypothetical protein